MSQAFDIFIHNGLIPVHTSYEPKHMIAGDTDSCYIDLSSVFSEDANPEEVTKFADEIGEVTNSSFPLFMKDVFNVSRERAKAIETEREAVSDRSYFLGKKKYMMHVINDEGIKVDKFKMMGLEIIRSDTPKIVQDFLYDICIKIMDGEPYEQVKEYIDQWKEDYKEKSLVEIGRPMQIKNLEKYMHKFEEQGNMKGFPYHVRAAMYYNSKCGISDKKIKSGSKIRIVYIHDHASDYIAVPVDMEEEPAFLKEVNIDWAKQMEKVEMKIQIYLKPIGFDLASRRSNIENELLEF